MTCKPLVIRGQLSHQSRLKENDNSALLALAILY